MLAECPKQAVVGVRELVRLHVVAASDSARDQAVKLAVRDDLLGILSGRLGRLTSPDEAYEWLWRRRRLIERIAMRRLRREGLDYTARVSVGRFAFPRRVYSGPSGRLVVPRGRYRAVRVELGRAAGRNWWCVLFPPLCLLGVSPGGAAALMAGKPVALEMHLKVVDMIRKLWGS